MSLSKKANVLDSAVVVKGYVENSLMPKFVESTDREVEDFLAASGGISDIASFRGKVLEKWKNISDSAARRQLLVP